MDIEIFKRAEKLVHEIKTIEGKISYYENKLSVVPDMGQIRVNSLVYKDGPLPYPYYVIKMSQEQLTTILIDNIKELEPKRLDLLNELKEIRCLKECKR